ncbi:hypothetical protein TBLA_0C06410 [Henningerozyma blattae CBS 6284]|uniref:PH-response regulator protein palI/RIM9 n=1 Tax=Henningerozyma blattae (strain ATCC 34711 / CBS 6284 / DSM 70876 / NBRC 10599 / NRRL Y-10934 / UCD 77-7) TaxID=1071380 RepID=I2H232_HENB6|nr:hypothetical protein TBLA_0C06410 [Tetrapisispora blattae CBS 6284]CCH60434.1 hypothetical protein TBLA_0C06410 [Tetrapisispora blattae CBS 6284]
MFGINRNYKIIFMIIAITYGMVLQILSNITVPVTHRFWLSSYRGITFGVYGWCVRTPPSNKWFCSDIKLGYETNSTVWDEYIQIPSNTDKAVSRLLVVHSISAIISIFMFILFIPIKHFYYSTTYILLLGIICVFCYIFSLLSFLVDILIFFSSLSWLGWINLSCPIIYAICSSNLWLMRRTAIIRKYEMESRMRDDEHNKFYNVEIYSMADNVKDSTNKNSDENDYFKNDDGITVGVPLVRHDTVTLEME